MYKDIYEIDLDRLNERGINGLVLDLDNTLVPWGSLNIDSKLKTWVDDLNKNGFKACLASNAGSQRGTLTAEKLGLPIVAPARKPFKRGFIRVLDILDLEPSEVAVIGDQLFTDMLGGNRAGLYTIMVNPIAKKEFWATQIIRILERMIIKRPS